MPSIDENTFHWVVGIMCSIIGALIVTLSIVLLHTIDEIRATMNQHQMQLTMVQSDVKAIAARQQIVIDSLEKNRELLLQEPGAH